MDGSHVEDLDLARRLADGDEKAWERFILEYRPLLYRAAHALDRTGGAREIADSLYADLYGIRQGDRPARSLFHYFQGRSSLATWLRAVLAQRYIDRLRAERRIEPLPDEECEAAMASTGQPQDPEHRRYRAVVGDALGHAVAALTPRDRLRLNCYYAQDLTLAETGRLLKEHEATVSRQLARTRNVLRASVEGWLRDHMGFNDTQIAECFVVAAEDPGALDLTELLGTEGRKEHAAGRS